MLFQKLRPDIENEVTGFVVKLPRIEGHYNHRFHQKLINPRLSATVWAGFGHFIPKMNWLEEGHRGLEREKELEPRFEPLRSAKTTAKGGTNWDVEGHVNRGLLAIWQQTDYQVCGDAQARIW
jgi:hypothetical protein